MCVFACVWRIQTAVCRADDGGLGFVVEDGVSGSVIVRGSGLLKDSCFRLASGEVRILYFFSGCPHFCEKTLETTKKNTVFDHLTFYSQQTLFSSSECCSFLIPVGFRSQSHHVPVSV